MDINILLEALSRIVAFIVLLFIVMVFAWAVGVLVSDLFQMLGLPPL